MLLAWQLRDAWALVFGLLIGDVARLILSHVLCPRPPLPCWDKSSVKELSHFGFSIFLNTLVYGGWIYFDRLAGPRFLSAEQMGFFFLAWSLAEALDNLIGRGSEVFYSMLSRNPLGEERAAFFRRTARRVALYLYPGLVVAAVIAPLAFRIVYPEKFWARPRCSGC